MFERLRSLFAPSLFEDEEKTRTVRILSSIGWVALIVLSISIAIRLLAGEFSSPFTRVFFFAIITALFITQLLLRTGRVKTSGYFLVIVIWGLLSVQAYVTDGLHDAAILAYPIIILLAALLLGWQAGLVTGLASIAMIWLFAVQEQYGWRINTADLPYPYARDLTAILIISSILTYILIYSLNRSLSDARLELRERLRSDEKLHQQARYLTALHETTFGLLNRLELKPLLESILTRTAELLGTPHVGIDFVTEDGLVLRQEMGYGLYEGWNGVLTEKGVGVTGKVWESGETIYVQDYGTWEERNPEADGLGFYSVIGTPLKREDKVLGVLIVSTTDKNHQLTLEQVALLERLAALAALAIDNARLYEDAQKELHERKAVEEDLRLSEERLQRQAHYLTALHETTFGLLNRLELNPLLESILLRARELLDTPHVGIDLVLPDGLGLRQELGIGEFTKWNKTTIQLGQGMVGKIWQTGETLVVDDYGAYEDKLAVASRSGFLTVAGTPLKSGSTVIGTLVVAYSEHSRVITPEQVAVLERLAALAALAIDNARLYEETQKDLTERKAIEQDLRSSEERFRKVFNNNNIAISIVTLEEGTFLEANEAFWKLSGLSPANAIGHTAVELNLWNHPDDRKAFVKTLLENGSLSDVEVEFSGDDQIRSAVGYYELVTIKHQLCILCMFYDISEQRRAQRELQESEERFRKVFNASPVAIVITSLEEGHILEANNAYWAMTGYDPNQSLGRSAAELGIWEDVEKRFEFVSKLKETRSSFNPNYQFVNKNDQKKITVAFSEIISFGKTEAILSMFYDVTEQKQVEEALKNAETRTRAIIASIPDMIFEVSKEGIFLDFMASAELTPIMEAHEFIGRNLMEMLPPKIAEQTMFALDRAVRTGQVHAFEYGLPPGEEIQFFEARVAPVTSDSAIIMVRDISQRKWVETEREKLINELESKNAESETLRESMAIIVETLDESRAVSLILEQLEKVIPYDSASVQLLRRGELEIVSVRGLEPQEKHVGRKFNADENEPSYPLFTGHSSYILLEDTWATGMFSPENDPKIRSWLAISLRVKGQVIGIIALDGRTVGQFTQKHAELALTYANQVTIALENARLFSQAQTELAERKKLIEELEGKNAELERFTYTVSHDLKSPIITIRGFLGFLERDALTGNLPRLQSDIKRISDATEKMQTLLNELLELSRIGRLVNTPTMVPFNEIVADALELVQGRIQAGDIRVQIQPDMPSVYVDRPRIVEVIQNLLDNAAKFTSNDPHIDVGQIGTQDDMPIFFVRDHGIGIDPVHHERIFGLFNKLDADTDGTGIGLALVKRIIEVHKGRVWVESEPQKGATFFFTLPTSPIPES